MVKHISAMPVGQRADLKKTEKSPGPLTGVPRQWEALGRMIC